MLKKVLINQKTKEKRLEFARKTIYINNLPQLLIFSDEKRFYFNGFNYSNSIWTYIHNKKTCNVIKIPKNFEKNSIMVWGTVSSAGLIDLQLCSKTLNSDEYIKIITKFIAKVSKYHPENKFFLIQDNATCHVSNKTLEFLAYNNISTLDWPPSSPDLNIIENVWKMLSDNVYANEKIFSNKSSLWDVLQVEFYKLDKEKI